MQLYSLKECTGKIAPKQGALTPFFELLDHVFSGQPATRQEFEQQIALRYQRPGVKMPIITMVSFEKPDHGGCPCMNLLADLMAAIGVKVEVLHGVSTTRCEYYTV
jgi:hypothetical protein